MNVRHWNCVFLAWLAWKGYACPIRHTHEKAPEVVVTSKRLSKPRSSRSHFIKMVRRSVEYNGFFKEA